MVNGIVIDLNRLTYREYRQYIEAGAAGDEIAILCKVVVAWEFEGDPADSTSYDDLGILDLLKVQAALREAIAEATGTGNTAGN
jgi:hypothetical protein